MAELNCRTASGFVSLIHWMLSKSSCISLSRGIAITVRSRTSGSNGFTCGCSSGGTLDEDIVGFRLLNIVSDIVTLLFGVPSKGSSKCNEPPQGQAIRSPEAVSRFCSTAIYPLIVAGGPRHLKEIPLVGHGHRRDHRTRG